MSFRSDQEYLKIVTEPIAVCANYLPKLGQGADAGYDLKGFQAIYRADPFYRWLGLDNPLMFAAHKAAGGMTSIYRQIGIGCERLFRTVLMDGFDLTEEQATWSYAKVTPGGKTQTLYLDGRIDLQYLHTLEAKTRVKKWMEIACRELEVNPDVAASLKGVVFEIRQGYKSKDSKRQNADIGNASTAYIKGYIPTVGVLSLQIDSDIEERYALEKWIVLKGISPGGTAHDSLYTFTNEIVGYDLAAFFERNHPALKQTIDFILRKLLTPDANP